MLDPLRFDGGAEEGMLGLGWGEREQKPGIQVEFYCRRPGITAVMALEFGAKRCFFFARAWAADQGEGVEGFPALASLWRRRERKVRRTFGWVRTSAYPIFSALSRGRAGSKESP